MVTPARDSIGLFDDRATRALRARTQKEAPSSDEHDPNALGVQIARFAELWSYPALRQTVSTRFNPRLSKSWAGASLETRTITLASSLKDDPARLEHVLFHELAHIIAYILVGRSEEPHGPTWQQLVRAAGHEPVLQLADAATPTATPRSDPRCFVHRCPICDFSRIARKPMKIWRCADCMAAGLDGFLVITEQRAAE